jgi:ATP-dependent Clp protease protease subunit
MDMYSPIDFQSEFRSYAMKHMGVTGSQFYYWDKMQSEIYTNRMVSSQPQGSMTPYILEERELRVTQMDIFSRLMMDRILWLAGPVNDLMSTTVQAQLLFLESLNKDDITIYVDSPGGSVKSGLSMIDNMMLCNADIKTVNTGMAASMGSLLLGAGTKGKRSTLRSSRVMLHQLSSGYDGNHQDNKISFQESEKYNIQLFELLGEFCDKDPKEVMDNASRDLWLNSKEAVEYGIVDEIIIKNNGG